jgi:AmmeMemoRadiSam system protein A
MSRSSPHSATPQSNSSSPEYSLEERRLLLGIAHRSILSTFHEQPKLEHLCSAHLTERRGVFTTLHLRGDLRGCVGYAMPVLPLHQAVAETAKAAAFEDSRFLPVGEAEATELEISLSILSPLFSIQPEEVQVGRHGLVASLGAFRGLLLPQVPVECGWDRETFLQQTCRKAGLPPDACHKGVQFEAFTAEVFGDADIVT